MIQIISKFGTPTHFERRANSAYDAGKNAKNVINLFDKSAVCAKMRVESTIERNICQIAQSY
ncbi:MAG: hypothetical protein FWD66_09980 [Paludibacter sp.]|nr:hypothetical protein [Paludibacter sp.]